MKIFVVASVWAGINTLIPLSSRKEALELEMLLLFVQRILFILVMRQAVGVIIRQARVVLRKGKHQLLKNFKT